MIRCASSETIQEIVTEREATSTTNTHTVCYLTEEHIMSAQKRGGLPGILWVWCSVCEGLLSVRVRVPTICVRVILGLSKDH